MVPKKPFTSAEIHFLHRVERQRLESECLRPLDLRQLTNEHCKHFSYRGRSLWLDPLARRLFIEGLERNAGVFTVETYEAILAHFDKLSIDHRQITVDPLTCNGTSSTYDGSVSSDFSIDTDRISSNAVFDLSYFEKRVYDRLKLTLAVRLIWQGQTLPAETRDLSITGLQLRVDLPLEIQEGDKVRVDVSPGIGRKLEQPELEYRVVRIRRLLHETLLALQCLEIETKDGLIAIVEQMTHASKLAAEKQADPEDALLTAQALLAERFYMRSTRILPFFLFTERNAGSPLRIIFSNGVNREALQAFETAPGYHDFSTILTLRRLKLLQRLAYRNSKADTLIAVFHPASDQAPKVMADLECKNHKHWCRLLLQHAEQPGFRVFKVVARRAHKPVAMRLADAVQPLSQHGNELLNRLLLDANMLSVVGALIDVTDIIRGWNLEAYRSGQDTAVARLQCREDRHIAPSPMLVPVRYIQENRSEPRYRGQMRVNLHLAKEVLAVDTQDLSVHGLSVLVNGPNIEITSGQRIAITIPHLEARSKGIARLKGIYHEVPAEVVGVLTEKSGGIRLQIRISACAEGRRFTKAFSDYLAQRQSRLPIDKSHALRAATSRLYSSIFIESSSTLPVFICRKSNKDWGFRLGLVSSPSPLTNFFEVADGEFDFSALSDQDRLAHLMHQVTEHGTAELTLYLQKIRRIEAPTFGIQSLADFEIPDAMTRSAFVRQALKHDFRCMKLIVSAPDIPPQVEIEQAIDRLVRLSPGKSERLKAEFTSLVAIGDLVDVTGLVEDTWNDAGPRIVDSNDVAVHSL